MTSKIIRRVRRLKESRSSGRPDAPVLLGDARKNVTERVRGFTVYPGYTTFELDNFDLELFNIFDSVRLDWIVLWIGDKPQEVVKLRGFTTLYFECKERTKP